MFFNLQLNDEVNFFSNNWEFRTNWTGSKLNSSLFRTFQSREISNAAKNKFYIEPSVLISFLPGVKLTGEKVLKAYFSFKISKLSYGSFTLPFLDEEYRKPSTDFLAERYELSSNLSEVFYPQYLWMLIKFFRWKLTVIIDDQIKNQCRQVIDLNQENLYHIDDQIKKRFTHKAPTYSLKQQILLPLSCFSGNPRNNIKFIVNSMNSDHHDILMEPQTIFEISFKHPRNQVQELAFDLTKKNFEIRSYYLHLFTNKVSKSTEIKDIDYESITFIPNLMEEYSNSQPFYHLWKYQFMPTNVSSFENWSELLRHFDYRTINKLWTKIINWHQDKAPGDSYSNVDYGDGNQLKIPFHIEPLRTVTLVKELFYTGEDDMFPPTRHLPQYNGQQHFLVHTEWDPATEKFVLKPNQKEIFLSNWLIPQNQVVVTNHFNLNTMFNFELTFKQNILFKNDFLNQNKLKFSKYPWGNISLDDSRWKVNNFMILKRHLEAIGQKDIFTWNQYYMFLKMWLIVYD